MGHEASELDPNEKAISVPANPDGTVTFGVEERLKKMRIPNKNYIFNVTLRNEKGGSRFWSRITNTDGSEPQDAFGALQIFLKRHSDYPTYSPIKRIKIQIMERNKAMFGK